MNDSKVISSSIPSLNVVLTSTAKTFREIMDQFLQNAPKEIGNYFVFLTGKEKADPTNPFNKWIKNKILPITKGISLEKSSSQKPLKAESLISQVDIVNTIILLSGCYQITSHRLQKSHEIEETQQLQHALRMFSEQLEIMYSKHPTEFTAYAFKGLKFNPDHVSRTFREELQSGRHAKNNTNLTRLITLVGLLFSGNLLLNIFAYQRELGIDCKCEPEKLLNISSPSTTPVIKVDPLQLPLFDVIEVPREHYFELLSMDGKARDLKVQVDTMKKHLDTLKNDPSEAAQVFYREKMRARIQNSFDTHFKHEGSSEAVKCRQMQTIDELLEIMRVSEDASDYEATINFAESFFVEKLPEWGRHNSEVANYARGLLIRDKADFAPEFIERVGISWLNQVETIPDSQQLLFSICTTNSAYESLRDALLNHINDEVSKDKRVAILNFINNWLRRVIPSTVEDPTKAAEAFKQVAKTALAHWEDGCSREEFEHIYKIVDGLLDLRECDQVLHSIENWLMSNDSDKCEKACKLGKMFVSLSQSYRSLANSFDPTSQLLKSYFLELVNKSELMDSKLLELVKRIASSPDYKRGKNTRVSLLELHENWLLKGKKIGNDHLNAIKMALENLPLNCPNTELVKGKELLEILVEKGNFELAISTALNWSRMNHKEMSAQIFTIVVDYVPLAQVPSIGSSLTATISNEPVPAALLDFLEKWSTIDYKASASQNNGTDIADAMMARENAIKILLKNTLKSGYQEDVEKAFRILGHLLQKNEGYEAFQALLETMRPEFAHLAINALADNIDNTLTPQMENLVKASLNKCKSLDQPIVIQSIDHLLTKLEKIGHYESSMSVAAKWLNGSNQQVIIAYNRLKNFEHSLSFQSSFKTAIEGVDEAHAGKAIQLLKEMIEKGYCVTPSRIDLVAKTVNQWKLSSILAADIPGLVVKAIDKGLYDIGISYAIISVEGQTMLSSQTFARLFNHQQGFKEFEKAAQNIHIKSVMHAFEALIEWIRHHQVFADPKPIAKAMLNKWTHHTEDSYIVHFAKILTFYDHGDLVMDRVPIDLKSEKFIAIKFFNLLRDAKKYTADIVENQLYAEPVTLSPAYSLSTDTCTPFDLSSEKAKEKAVTANENFRKVCANLINNNVSIPLQWLKDDQKSKESMQCVFDLIDFELETVKPDNCKTSKAMADFALDLSRSSNLEDQKKALKIYTKLAKRGIWISSYEGKDLREPGLTLASKLVSKDVKGVTEFLTAGVNCGAIGLRDNSKVVDDIINRLLIKQDIDNSIESLELVYKMVDVFAVKGKSEEVAIQFIDNNLGDEREEAVQFVYNLAVFLDAHGGAMSTNKVLKFWQTSSFHRHQDKAYELANYMINRSGITERDLISITEVTNQWRQKSYDVAQAKATKFYAELLKKDWENTFEHALDAAGETVLCEEEFVQKEGQNLFKFMYATLDQQAQSEMQKKRLGELDQRLNALADLARIKSPVAIKFLGISIDRNNFAKAEEIAKDIYKSYKWDYIPFVNWFGDHQARIERSLILFEALTTNQEYRNAPGFPKVIPYIKTAVEYAISYKMNVPEALRHITS